MITKWQSVKSWWYWKVSSKYDMEDLFVFTFFPLMIFFILLQMYGSAVEYDKFAEECIQKNGMPVKSHHKYICVDVKAIK